MAIFYTKKIIPISDKLFMEISALLRKNAVLTDVVADNKFDLISTMLATLSSEIDAVDLQAIEQAVLERERIMPTGVGNGLGIPHCKTKAVKNHLLVVALLRHPIEYGSIDNIPVRFVILLISPADNDKAHLMLLSRISKLMNSDRFRKKLYALQTQQEILDAFKTEEEKHAIV